MSGGACPDVGRRSRLVTREEVRLGGFFLDHTIFKKEDMENIKVIVGISGRNYSKIFHKEHLSKAKVLKALLKDLSGFEDILLVKDGKEIHNEADLSSFDGEVYAMTKTRKLHESLVTLTFNCGPVVEAVTLDIACTVRNLLKHVDHTYTGSIGDITSNKTFSIDDIAVSPEVCIGDAVLAAALGCSPFNPSTEQTTTTAHAVMKFRSSTHLSGRASHTKLCKAPAKKSCRAAVKHLSVTRSRIRTKARTSDILRAAAEQFSTVAMAIPIQCSPLSSSSVTTPVKV